VIRRAAFLDRDGTIIEDATYLADPSAMRLLPGAAEAVRRLNAAGVPCVVVTNQSGIARGLVTEDQYEGTRRRLDALLASQGAELTAHYHCPHHPDISGPCECRKPGTQLYRRAAAELGLDLATSLFVGDRWRDVAPGIAFGGIARMVPSPGTPAEELDRASAEGLLARTLADAADEFLAHGER
jgi:D-glycero-D-manno-heptose 1,7-bisphosphate phosphatase